MLDLMRMFGELNSIPTTPRMNIDILDKEDHYEIHADLPGYAKEDISIEYNDCMLTISAEQKMNTKETKNDYICSERYHGNVSRSIRVGEINPATIKASMQNGTLVISFPKVKETPKTRKINID